MQNPEQNPVLGSAEPAAALAAPLPLQASAAAGGLRGDMAVWVFILAELGAFAAFFIAYAFTRSRNIELFNEYQLTLDRSSGAINTVLLVTASALVARAVAVLRKAASVAANGSAAPGVPDAAVIRQAARLTLLGIVCGFGFIGFKLAEFTAKFSAGVSLSTNSFYMFYLSLTGFHFLHVVLGLAVLLILWRQVLGVTPDNFGERLHNLESGAAYWHMVDLVWLVLFPLVYVMR